MQPRFHAGNNYPDVAVYDDGALLGLNASNTHRPKRLGLIHDDHQVFGLEITYRSTTQPGDISSGLHLGSNPSAETRDTNFDLAEDEHITEFGGAVGKGIDRLYFVTNKGRNVTVGGPTGTPFQFQAPLGHHFATFVAGVGASLAHIELKPVLIPGGLNLGGLPVPGGAGLNLGGLPPPPGHVVVSPYENLPPKNPIIHRSTIAGNKDAGSQFFDDMQQNFKDLFFDPELTTLTVYYNINFVLGIEASYKDLNGSYGPYKHLGSNAVMIAPQTASITLDFGEGIEEFSGRVSEKIDYLKIKTSKGKLIEVGSPVGGTPFSLLPAGGLGKKIHGIGGATNFALQNLYVYFH
eukprot:TRINITY_DN0_c41_g1_i4.p1 TRINITY_DN0_c41_g1~~TRINITY_DN0_c41_g1_i4.p1  ORF type:complete len:350 (-),score=112.58 TRINITY_DN0_c41_g1_i4:69-1118(-)